MPPHHRAFTNSVEERRKAQGGVVTRRAHLDAQAAISGTRRGVETVDPSTQQQAHATTSAGDSVDPTTGSTPAPTRKRCPRSSTDASAEAQAAMDERPHAPRRSARLSRPTGSPSTSSPHKTHLSPHSDSASASSADQAPLPARSSAEASSPTSEPHAAQQPLRRRSPKLDQNAPHPLAADSTSAASAVAVAATSDRQSPLAPVASAEQPTMHMATSPRPPQLQRRLSMPSSNTHRRTRASSYSPEPSRRQATMARAAPGPSNGRIDPDTHWLSEDEGRTSFHSGAASARPRGSAARGLHGSEYAPHNDDDDDQGDGCVDVIDGKQRRDAATFGSTTHRMHSIHHRPSTALHSSSIVSRPSSPDSPTPWLVPNLVPIVMCKACDKLLLDPTTLACGHSVCLACSVPVVHRAADLPAFATLPQAIGIAHTESQFARNPSIPLSPSSIMSRSSSAGSRVSELLHRTRSGSTDVPLPRIAPSPASSAQTSLDKQPKVRCPATKAKCPHKDCDGAKERPGASKSASEPHIDFTLQKVVMALRQAVPNIDDEIERVKEEIELDALAGDDEWDEQDAPIESGMVRSDSGSSLTGGVESPLHDDDQKRGHKTKDQWSPIKRLRRLPSPFADCIAARLVIDYDRVPQSFQSDLASDLECQICVQLLYEPITPACGHTFCQSCLARSYDHSDKCPLCRQDFPSYTYFRSQAVNSTLKTITSTLFPALYAERQAAATKELADNEFVPLFVCTLSWPNLPTFIHVFEPRYRLMIRRAMDSNRQFGMVLPGRQAGEINEFGTMLYIHTCNMIEDGRSIVETVGLYRFKILERSTRDGYAIGRVERIDDISPEQELELERVALESNNEPLSVHTSADHGGEETSPPPRMFERSTAELMSICLEFVETLRSGSAPWVIQRLNNTIGPMPTNPADFSFWMAEVMPVDDQLKATLLQITSPRARLRLIVFWIEQVRSSWWFSRGCAIM
ncbi:hypothetical protein OIV83_003147 [Microbotryomycetes sp. JL201]|nr:hypothetical protein OIV83_003147 [Microbotryomycetes sp. JL201]